MNTAAAQLKRLLLLLPRFADGEDHELADVAAELGVLAEQLIEDLQSLTERFDMPAGFREEVRVFHDGTHVSVTSPHFLRPMRLTMAELCALELGLTMLVRERAGDEVAAVERSLERLREVIAKIPGDDRYEGLREAALEAGGVPSERLATLKGAVSNKRKVRVLYRKGSATTAEWHIVCPYSMYYANGMWYLVGHCEREPAEPRSKIQLFRLDRVERVEPASGTYNIPADYPGDRLFTRGKPFMADDLTATVRIRYGAAVARWIAEREGRELNEDGTLVVERPLADEMWAVRHVLQYGTDAEVLAPESVRELVRKRLQGMA